MAKNRKFDGSGAVSGAASGAAVGSAIAPGIGTAIGTVGGALFGGIGGDLFGGSDAEKEAERARQRELQALELQYPEAMRELRDSFYEGGVRNDLYNVFGGTREDRVSEEEIQSFINANPDIQLADTQRINELTEQKELLEAELRGLPPNLQRTQGFQIQGQINKLRSEINQVQKGGVPRDEILRMIEKTDPTLRFDPESGELLRGTKIDPIERDLTFEGDKRIPMLSNTIFSDQQGQRRGTISALSENINNQTENVDSTIAGLLEVLGNTDEGREIANSLLFNRDQSLSSDSDLLRSLATNRQSFQDEVGNALNQAQTLNNNLNQDTESLIQSIEQQIDEDLDRQIQGIRDDMARKGFAGSGIEDSRIQRAVQQANRAKQQQIASLRLNANQQNFQNNVTAQNNVAGLAKTASGLQSQGQSDILSAFGAANTLGQQRLSNNAGVQNQNLGLSRFNADILNQVGALRGGLNDSVLQRTLSRLRTPATINQESLATLLAEDARKNNINQQNLSNINNERNFISSIVNNANANAGFASNLEGRFATNHFNNAANQSANASRATSSTLNTLGYGLSELFENNRQNNSSDYGSPVNTGVYHGPYQEDKYYNNPNSFAF